MTKYLLLSIVAIFVSSSCLSASDDLRGPFDIPMKTPEELAGNNPSISNLRQQREVDEKVQQPKGHTRQSEEELFKFNQDKQRRMKERREKAKAKLASLQPDLASLTQLSEDEIKEMYDEISSKDPGFEKEDNKWMRNLWGSSSSSNPYTSSNLADVSESYDWWSQGYRMLGGFIDCDNQKDEGSGDKDGGGDNGGACSRWMMWAAYINPNYEGGGRDEYFNYNSYYDDEDGDDNSQTTSKLDCHSQDTEWVLLGVYRQEFYQFFEQISKHLWAIDEYEYVVALAGLAYMTDYDCFNVGYSSSGDALYAGIEPYSGGNFRMSLYTDASCLQLDTSSGLTYDDFGLTSDMSLGSNDNGCMDDDALYSYWQSAQEYTLSLLNEVYEEYKYCTLCMDYPTYQDGYVIGDDGTDEDDLINQCWKFHSHDSYTCETECLALGDKQGSIVAIDYNGVTYGASWDGTTSSGSQTTYDHYKSGYTSDGSRMDRFKANAWLTFNGVLFIATFLAFSVARGSRSDKSSDKRRSLLSRQEREVAGRKKKRSKSSKTRSRSFGDDKSRGSRKSSKSSSSKKKRSVSASRSKKSAHSTLKAQY